MANENSSSWKPTRFRSLLSAGVRNGLYKAKKFHGRGAKIVNMGELFGHPRLGAVPMKRVEIDTSEFQRFGLQANDLIFARRSLTAEGAGKCSLVMEVDEPTVFESSIIRARPDPQKVSSLFLYYLWSSPLGMHLLDTIRRQVAVAGITGKDLEEVEVPIPGRAEQEEIAETLGALDDKIEQNRRTGRTLEVLARATFKAWFVDFEPVKAKAAGATTFPGLPAETFAALPDRLTDSLVGPVPQGWEVKPLSEAFEVNPPRRLAKGVDAPHLDMKNMPTDGHAPDQWERRPHGSGMKFINGDTLVARITPCLENGKTAYVDFLNDGEVAWGSTEYIVLRPKPPLPPIFAYCLARMEPFRDYAIQNMSGTSGRQRVAASAMEHYNIAVPDSPTARSFGEVVGPFFEYIRAGKSESAKLASLRDYLLPRLLSGRVRVKDAQREVEYANA